MSSNQGSGGSPLWTLIPSLKPFVDLLTPAFTQPSAHTACHLLLAWVLCLGRHTLLRVARSTRPDLPPDNSQRHGLDAYYNFLERAAWTPKDLAYRVGVLLLTTLKIFGTVTLLVDDTLTHKRGSSVWGMGWFRDAVASTKKRVATASGHNGVVVAVAYCLPGAKTPLLAFPLVARLHQSGKDQPSCADLAREMLAQILEWFPHRRFTLVGDGAYACKELLLGLEPRVGYVGRLRGDAAWYDPRVPPAQPGQRGRKPKKGPRISSPQQAALQADRPEATAGWPVVREVCVRVYGQERVLRAFSYQAVWPRVLGLRTIQVVVVRDPEGRMKDASLFTTQLPASLAWVIEQFAGRWSIEVLFRCSKQVLEIEAPQHWCEASVQKVAPWVWSLQSVIMAWYLESGQELAEAKELRSRMGPWDSEWSLRHMLQVLRSAILNATINPDSGNKAQLREMVRTLKNWANLAA